MTKTNITISGNTIPVDTEANVSTDWRVWLAALAITAAGIGGVMAAMIWLMG